MSKTIIVGAGPMGLLTGILLHLKGVKDLQIIDPRAGTYLRPGHINLAVFDEVEWLIKDYLPPADRLDFSLFPSRSLHIKEMERMLYQKAISLGIKITKHSFLRLVKGDKTSKGIKVLCEETAREMLMPAQHVFDCTGGRRAVCQSYNTQSATDTFIEKKVFENVIIPNHLLYNVCIRNTDTDHIERAQRSGKTSFKALQDATVQETERLRQFGWDRAVSPTMYTHRGTHKGDYTKYCFYVEAPTGLPKEKYDGWFKACFDIYVSGAIIELYDLNPSKKHGKDKERVRKQTFIIDPSYLACYEGVAPTNTLSGVYPVGDSQTTPDSRLAHGISDGQDRVGALILSCTVNDRGELTGINLEKYRKAIKYNIQHHNDRIRRLHKSDRIAHEAVSAKKLKLKYQIMLTQQFSTMKPEIKTHIGKTIHQLNMIQEYYALFGKDYPVSIVRIGRILKGSWTIKASLKKDSLKKHLRLSYLLKDMLDTLPPSFIKERENIVTLIGHLVSVSQNTVSKILTDKSLPLTANESRHCRLFFSTSTMKTHREKHTILDEAVSQHVLLFELLLASPYRQGGFIKLVTQARHIVALYVLRGDAFSANKYGKHLYDILNEHPITHSSLEEFKQDLIKLPPHKDDTDISEASSAGPVKAVKKTIVKPSSAPVQSRKNTSSITMV